MADDTGSVVGRQVEKDEVEQLYIKYKTQLNSPDHPQGVIPIFETSSKQDANVDQVFEYAFQTLSQQNDGGGHSHLEDSIRLHDGGGGRGVGEVERERDVVTGCCG